MGGFIKVLGVVNWRRGGPIEGGRRGKRGASAVRRGEEQKGEGWIGAGSRRWVAWGGLKRLVS